ncbi:site-specific integrase [Paenalkalicoccus suaedae]|uniref:Site-specific integrase n=1 Tax=Paenalkalicoccus suaedae TaxID=2592382 RepID=A0A859FEU7_9BACI|nr:tyrosine-type recombinase/integrase [Paenalkalicoccus suaedae]QKS71699.1 site-specific integrase [Paenalkalicoccus suaedae]QKS71753.1 site-specific integrase [Paenalkalicoccus suaedae]
MYIRKITTKSGEERWQCTGEGPPDPVTGKRRQVVRRDKGKTKAKQKVLDALAALKLSGEDRTEIGRKISFKEVADEWIKNYAMTGVKRGTIRIREDELNILFKRIGSQAIGSISHASYQSLINKLAKDYALNTIQGVHITANMVFKFAKNDGLIKKKPTDDIKMPKIRKTVEDLENDDIDEAYLETDELSEFLEVVRHDGLNLDLERFYLLAFTGLRTGELCALKWSDVDFTANTIRVTKSIFSERNNMKIYVLETPKTSGSVRTIQVESEIMSLLSTLKRDQQKQKMKYMHFTDDYHDANFVFCREDGYPYLQGNLVLRMKRLIKKSSITKHATPHILRHTHISMLTEAGVDIATIMERVGHEKMETTMKIYTHVTKKMKKDASDKVRSLHLDALSQLKSDIM